MLTRNLPFKGDYDSAMIYAILNEEPKELSTVPKEFQQIVDKCLSKNPFERYQSINELMDDLKKQKLIEGSGTTTRTFVRKKKSRKLFYLVAGVIVVAVLAIAYWKFFQSGLSQSEKSKFIAVLPFHPITSSEEDKNFAEGIHDDILTQLAKIRELKVIARTSVMHYQNTQKTIKEIANELGVGVVLEGSTRRSGDMIRITAQLIDAETEEHLWADSYDRPYTDIFTIQSDVAQKIASALQIKLAKEELASIETIPTENMEAWEYFQKGKYFWYNYFDFDGNLKAAQMFEKACELDTNFAVAYAWQARVYLVVYLYANVNRDQYLNRYKYAIAKAEALAPDIPEINFAKSSYLVTVEGDWDAATKEIEIANRKRPNDYDFLNLMAGLTGDLDLAEKVYQLNPKSMEVVQGFWGRNMTEGNFIEAEKWADRLIEIKPESSVGHEYKLDILINVFGDLKRAEKVLDDAEKIVTMEKNRLAYWEFLISFYQRDYKNALMLNEKVAYYWKHYNKAFLLRLLQKNEEVKVYFDSLRIECLNFFKENPDANDGQRTMNLALAYAGVGEKEKALNEIAKVDSGYKVYAAQDVAYFYMLIEENNIAIKSLEESVSKPTGPTYGMLKLNPLLDPLRGDSRFQKIVVTAEERIKKTQR
jgi:TolB-like protein